MSESLHTVGPLKGWRAARRRRRAVRQAVRAEFVLDPPSGLVSRLRAYAQSVQELERARLASHAVAERQAPRAIAPATRDRAARR